MARHRLDILDEPRGQAYVALLRLMETIGTEGSLIVRSSFGSMDPVASFLQALRRYGTTESTVSEWPGTKIDGETATLVRFTLTTAMPLIIETTSGLYDWVSPNLPEDLAIYRSNGTVCLLSCSHERFSELFLDEEEQTALMARCPSLQIASL